MKFSLVLLIVITFSSISNAGFASRFENSGPMSVRKSMKNYEVHKCENFILCTLPLFVVNGAAGLVLGPAAAVQAAFTTDEPATTTIKQDDSTVEHKKIELKDKID